MTCFVDTSKISMLETLKNEILYLTSRSSPPEVFLGIGILKICSKFTGKHPYRRMISIKLQSNFIEITRRHGCSPVNLLHFFRTPFPMNTSEGLLLHILFVILGMIIISSSKCQLRDSFDLLF